MRLFMLVGVMVSLFAGCNEVDSASSEKTSTQYVTVQQLESLKKAMNSGDNASREAARILVRALNKKLDETKLALAKDNEGNFEKWTNAMNEVEALNDALGKDANTGKFAALTNKDGLSWQDALKKAADKIDANGRRIDKLEKPNNPSPQPSPPVDVQPSPPPITEPRLGPSFAGGPPVQQVQYVQESVPPGACYSLWMCVKKRHIYKCEGGVVYLRCFRRGCRCGRHYEWVPVPPPPGFPVPW